MTIDHDVEKEVERDAHRQQAAELAAAAQRNRERIKDHQDIERQQRQPANEPELLGDHRDHRAGFD